MSSNAPIRPVSTAKMLLGSFDVARLGAAMPGDRRLGAVAIPDVLDDDADGSAAGEAAEEGRALVAFDGDVAAASTGSVAAASAAVAAVVPLLGLGVRVGSAEVAVGVPLSAPCGGRSAAADAVAFAVAAAIGSVVDDGAALLFDGGGSAVTRFAFTVAARFTATTSTSLTNAVAAAASPVTLVPELTELAPAVVAVAAAAAGEAGSTAAEGALCVEVGTVRWLLSVPVSTCPSTAGSRAALVESAGDADA